MWRKGRNFKLEERKWLRFFSANPGGIGRDRQTSLIVESLLLLVLLLLLHKVGVDNEDGMGVAA